MQDPVHEGDHDGQHHDRGRAVDDQTEGLQDGAELGGWYALAPSRLALRVMTSGPSHMPMNRLVKASSLEPEVPNAPMEAVTREMMSGPHMSHWWRILS